MRLYKKNYYIAVWKEDMLDIVVVSAYSIKEARNTIRKMEIGEIVPILGVIKWCAKRTEIRRLILSSIGIISLGIFMFMTTKMTFNEPELHLLKRILDFYFPFH